MANRGGQSIWTALRRQGPGWLVGWPVAALGRVALTDDSFGVALLWAFPMMAIALALVLVADVFTHRTAPPPDR
jgi:cytochrome c-type biogenesis protein CcmH/NrfF